MRISKISIFKPISFAIKFIFFTKAFSDPDIFSATAIATLADLIIKESMANQLL